MEREAIAEGGRGGGGGAADGRDGFTGSDGADEISCSVSTSTSNLSIAGWSGSRRGAGASTESSYSGAAPAGLGPTGLRFGTRALTPHLGQMNGKPLALRSA